MYLRSILACAFVAGLLSAQGSTPITAQLSFPTQGPKPTKVRLRRAFPNLNFIQPTFITHAFDGSNRFFATERAGVVSFFPNDPNVSVRTIFLDLRNQVESGPGEAGLLGMTFDPDYQNNGYFYVYYCVLGGTPRTRLSRFSVSQQDPDKADPTSEKVILEIPQDLRVHNGGMLAFGPDKMLYVGVADGGPRPEDAQDRSNLLGSILRIDVHGQTGSLPYGIPVDNPFVGAGSGIREEIWAYGLRAPWRFSFDSVDGRLFACDVGNDNREETNLIRKGGNYGWPVYEGELNFRNPQNLPPSAFDQPLVTYTRNEARALIGGYVYRGQRLPELRGAFIHADAATGNIWALVENNGKLVSNTLIATLNWNWSTFFEAPDKELYVVSYQAGLGLVYFDRDNSTTPTFPTKLSMTSLFSNLKTLTPAPGVYPYSVRQPFWSDHAIKKRWFAYPGTQIGFSATGAWDFAKGTVLVKQMDMLMREGDPSSKRRIATRVMIHEDDGWAGYTYRWNAAQTDADLVDHLGDTETLEIKDRTGTNTVRTQVWRYPSRSECMQCHTRAGGYALSANTRQLNTPIMQNRQQVEQLEYWNSLGMFSSNIGSAQQYGRFAEIGDPSVSIEEHARTWLHINCAMCHQPGGGTSSSMDLRFDIPLTQTNIWDVKPVRSDLGLRDPRIAKPFEHKNSVLWERVQSLGAARMPQIGSNVVDEQAVELLKEWIGSPVVSFGSSCGLMNPPPRLEQRPDAEARLGSTLIMDVSPLPTNEGALFIFGTSKTAWGPLPLPIALDGVGMLGCDLRVSIDLLVAVAANNNLATMPLPIPNDPQLLYRQFFMQSLALQQGSSPFGGVMTNAAQVTIIGP